MSSFERLIVFLQKEVSGAHNNLYALLNKTGKTISDTTLVMKEFIKKIIKSLPIAITRNQRYDAQTVHVIKRVCQSDSNCIDVGCHKGEILDLMRRYAPAGHHHGFEPIPDLYSELAVKYASTSCTIHNIALSNIEGTATFNFVVSNPAYSGLLKRQYDNAREEDRTIEVKTAKLSEIIDPKQSIALIKIDVEGAEYQVLEGAAELIHRDRPIILFEHGMGASDVYGTTPEMVFDYFSQCGYSISLMKDWLRGAMPFTKEAFVWQYYNKKNYFFIAYGT